MLTCSVECRVQSDKQRSLECAWSVRASERLMWCACEWVRMCEKSVTNVKVKLVARAPCPCLCQNQAPTSHDHPKLIESLCVSAAVSLLSLLLVLGLVRHSSYRSEIAKSTERPLFSFLLPLLLQRQGRLLRGRPSLPGLTRPSAQQCPALRAMSLHNT